MPTCVTVFGNGVFCRWNHFKMRSDVIGAGRILLRGASVNDTQGDLHEQMEAETGGRRPPRKGTPRTADHPGRWPRPEACSPRALGGSLARPPRPAHQSPELGGTQVLSVVLCHNSCRKAGPLTCNVYLLQEGRNPASRPVRSTGDKAAVIHAQPTGIY